jgi:hypothetical protein
MFENRITARAVDQFVRTSVHKPPKPANTNICPIRNLDSDIGSVIFHRREQCLSNESQISTHRAGLTCLWNSRAYGRAYGAFPKLCRANSKGGLVLGVINSKYAIRCLERDFDQRRQGEVVMADISRRTMVKATGAIGASMLPAGLALAVVERDESEEKGRLSTWFSERIHELFDLRRAH